MKFFFPTYEATSYKVELIHENSDGKTTEIRTYDCEAFDEAMEWMSANRWAYWETCKVYLYAMNYDTGEVEEILLR